MTFVSGCLSTHVLCIFGNVQGLSKTTFRMQYDNVTVPEEQYAGIGVITENSTKWIE